MAKKQQVWATVYTDAGFKDGQGTWGVWIRTLDERIIQNGICHEKITDSNLAEMYAILAGVIIVLRSYPDRDIDGILVKSDSQVALKWAMWNGGVRNNLPAAKMRARLWALLGERDCRLRCVWVKGHQHPGRGTPAYLNNQVDKLATGAREGQTGAVRQKVSDRSSAAGPHRRDSSKR